MANDTYPPELIDLMAASFDAAYDRLEAEPSQAQQLQFATRIMAAVNAGERNLERLTAIALGEDADQVDTADPASARLAEEPSSATDVREKASRWNCAPTFLPRCHCGTAFTRPQCDANGPIAPSCPSPRLSGSGSPSGSLWCFEAS